jgi:type I restriction enzyme S subunit
MGSTHQTIYMPDVERISTPLPPLATQRAIADLLDAETARIDALIAKKRNILFLIREREQALLFAMMGDWRTQPMQTLRQFGAKVLTGPFGTQLSAGEYVCDGIPLVNPTHIQGGRLVPESHITVDRSTAARLSRHKLYSGDIVMGRKGNVGRSAIVTDLEEGWICGSDSIAIRTGALLRPGFLSLWLRLHLARQYLAAASTGAMMANVNESLLLTLPVPKVGLAAQHSIEEAFQRRSNPHYATETRLVRQIDLLIERRQALITSAVIGELEIPAAS